MTKIDIIQDVYEKLSFFKKGLGTYCRIRI